MTEFATPLSYNSPFSSHLNELIQSAQKSCYPNHTRFTVADKEKYCDQKAEVLTNQTFTANKPHLRAYDIDLSSPVAANGGNIFTYITNDKSANRQQVFDIDHTSSKDFTDRVNTNCQPDAVPPTIALPPIELPLIVKPLRQSQKDELKALKKNANGSFINCRHNVLSVKSNISCASPKENLTSTFFPDISSAQSWRISDDIGCSADSLMAKYEPEKLINVFAEQITDGSLTCTDQRSSQHQQSRNLQSSLSSDVPNSQKMTTTTYEPYGAYSCHATVPVIEWKSSPSLLPPQQESFSHSSSWQRDTIKADDGTRSTDSTSYERDRRLTIGSELHSHMRHSKNILLKDNYSTKQDHSQNSLISPATPIPPAPPTSTPPVIAPPPQPSGTPFFKTDHEPSTRKSWFSSSVDGPPESNCSATLPRSHPKRPRVVKKNSSVDAQISKVDSERIHSIHPIQRSQSFAPKAGLPYIDDDENSDPNILLAYRLSMERNIEPPPKPARSYTEFPKQKEATMTSIVPTAKHSLFTANFFRDITKAKNFDGLLSSAPKKCKIFRRKSALASNRPPSPSPYEYVDETIRGNANLSSHLSEDDQKEAQKLFRSSNFANMVPDTVVQPLNVEHFRNQSTHSVDSGCFMSNSRKSSVDNSESFLVTGCHQKSSAVNEDAKWLPQLSLPCDKDNAYEHESEDDQFLSSSRRNSLVVRTQTGLRVRTVIDKLLNSSGRDQRRALFSLKQIFQDDKDLVHEFVQNGGLQCMIKLGRMADQNHQNYILRALGQVMLYVDGMNGIIAHIETIQWLYELLDSPWTKQGIEEGST
ncbi:unnamed protein product [Toxocara canis]|uniref:GBD/FH3 domain-containing protein n=1 Tax=Toxocara canis TaxID=6265 RepID=A0A183UYT6_TOXCA|nr:unnamed protein product [Toxocara canis]